MAEEAGRCGRRRRADRQPRDRQGQRRSAVAGRRRADRAVGQGRRQCRGRRGDRADRRRAPPRSGCRPPAQAAANATTNPAGAERNAGAARRRSCARSRQARRPAAGPDRHHLVARRPPRGARISCRPDQDQGHRQGRAADQGRCDRRRRGAEECVRRRQAGAQAPRRKPLPRRQRPLRRRTAPAASPASGAKSASRCRGFARPSPSG